MDQWVKDLVLSLLWLGSLLWHEFNSWPRNFHIPWAWQKKKIFFLKKNYFSNLQTWDIFPFIYIFFSYFHQCFIFSSIRSFTSLVKCIPIIFKAILNGFVFLISFSQSLLLVCRNITDFFLYVEFVSCKFAEFLY